MAILAFIAVLDYTVAYMKFYLSNGLF